MADSILVATTKAISAALTTAATGFEIATLTVGWDFEGRTKDIGLSDETGYLTVVVPRKYEQVEQTSRTQMSYVAAFDIDLLKRFGTGVRTAGIVDRDTISQYTRVLEQIHDYFESIADRRIVVTSAGMVAEWIAEREGIKKQSEILVAYSQRHLRENGQYFGCCREVFEISEGS